MNKWCAVGRLYKDPEVRYTTGENKMAIATFGVACDRKFKRDGEPTADFVGCKALGKQGEFVEKYLRKGTKVALTGRIQTGSYEKDGKKIYTTDIIVEEIEFAESKNASANSQPKEDESGFEDIPAGVDEELPFD